MTDNLKKVAWWIKWMATASSVTLVFLTSNDIIPANKWAGLVAATLWMSLGILWKEPALWSSNSLFAGLYIYGLMHTYHVI